MGGKLCGVLRGERRGERRGGCIWWREVESEQQIQSAAHGAVGETVILLRPPLPLAGVSIAMERDRQQSDSLANGCVDSPGRTQRARGRRVSSSTCR